MGFVTGQALTTAIADAMSGNRRDMAVAYWGTGAAERLGIGNASGVRILCDLWSGCCNPFELERLIAAGASVWDSPRLHAKVYIGDSRLVTGSANASINGLGEEGETFEREAGWTSDHLEQLASASAWFETVLADAAPVADLEDLKSWWTERPRNQRPSASTDANPSLLGRVLANPASLAGVGFVFVDTMSAAAIIQEAKNVASRDVANREQEIVGWNPRNMFTEWPAATIRRWPGEFFEFYLGSRGQLTVSAFRLQVRSEEAEAVFCDRDWRQIAGPLGLGSAQQVSQADAELATEFFQRLGSGEVFRSAQELATSIRRLVPEIANGRGV